MAKVRGNFAQIMTPGLHQAFIHYFTSQSAWYGVWGNVGNIKDALEVKPFSKRFYYRWIHVSKEQEYLTDKWKYYLTIMNGQYHKYVNSDLVLMCKTKLSYFMDENEADRLRELIFSEEYASS